MPRAKSIRAKSKSRLTAWSFSRWETYSNCPRQARLKFLDKSPEHPRPLRPGQSEQPNERGARIHELSEHVIQNPKAKIPHELRNFEPEYRRLQKLFQDGRVIVEEDWYFDEDWQPLPITADYEDIWLRVKLDILVWINNHYLVAIDGKTGKRRYNEIKHADQTNLYQLASFIRFPEIERVDTELWYFDLPELIHSPFSRSFGTRSMARWDKRARQITQDTEFKPDPSIDHCRFCPYKTGSNKWLVGNGQCDLNPKDDRNDDDEETYREKLAGLMANI